VPEGVNLIDRDTTVALYQRLLERPLHSVEELEAWVLDRSELESAVGQAGAVLYVRMTCQTDDEDRAKAYKEYVTTVVPALAPLSDKLDRKYITARDQLGMPATQPAGRYDVHDRALRADIELFRQENVELNRDVSLLSQEYQTLCGAMTVRFRGEERTLAQMGKFLQEPDRPLRKSAWIATARRRLKDKDKLEELFDKMLALRQRIAANAGFERYIDYRFKELHRFYYTPQDCVQYHQAVERHVVPLWARMLDERRRRMKLRTLRPWDTSVDPLGRPPLKPFDRPEGLIAGTQAVFTQLDPELGQQFASMGQMGLLDLASRKGKAPGGYQTSLAEARKPFIFMNAVGLDRDVRTLLHEGGHAFHALAAVAEPLLPYRHAPMEFCEVASMGMELLAGDHMTVFYDQDEDFRRSRREHLEEVLWILPWVATIDSFQHWLYEHPGHSADQRCEAWLAALSRFDGGVIDWSGLEEQQAHLWHRQLHIFEVPFYYIEYGLAQLGALQLWVKARSDPEVALAGYRAALALGGSKPLPELFAAAGLRFDFSAETIAPLAAAVAEELERME
jgi:oligoendopeptidase F